MTKPTPQFSRTQVNRAGDILLLPNPTFEELEQAFEVLNNWRSCHAYPINTFQATLRDKINRIGLKQTIVAQRLKRQTSIINKLYRIPGMQLSRMQDIGGLRAVVNTYNQVKVLEEDYRNSWFQHELLTTTDYIANPKASGYRSVHLVYKYSNEKNPAYNGLRVELQIRNKLQHAWATAVETMGTFLEQALKSSEGPEEWLDFFALTGSGFAHLEDCPPVPGYEGLSAQETYKNATAEARRLDVRNRLEAYRVAVDMISADKKLRSYHLIILDSTKKTVTIRAYGRNRLEEANNDYTETERNMEEGTQVVLVSTGDIGALQRAYPNYFLDTTEFIRALDRISMKIK